MRYTNPRLLYFTLHLSTPKRRKAEWSWLADYSGRFTHISGNPSAAGRAQDSESSPVRDRRSTTVPRNQCMVKGTHEISHPAQLQADATLAHLMA